LALFLLAVFPIGDVIGAGTTCPSQNDRDKFFDATPGPGGFVYDVSDFIAKKCPPSSAGGQLVPSNASIISTTFTVSEVNSKCAFANGDLSQLTKFDQSYTDMKWYFDQQGSTWTAVNHSSTPPTKAPTQPKAPANPMSPCDQDRNEFNDSTKDIGKTKAILDAMVTKAKQGPSIAPNPANPGAVNLANPGAATPGPGGLNSPLASSTHNSPSHHSPYANVLDPFKNAMKRQRSHRKGRRPSRRQIMHDIKLLKGKIAKARGEKKRGLKRRLTGLNNKLNEFVGGIGNKMNAAASVMDKVGGIVNKVSTVAGVINKIKGSRARNSPSKVGRRQ